ncbi:hypothetical protein ACFW1F_03095 [Streptomyces bungoensis]|uniref:hypothetical protein n=1 Tax=Streptomyces bungoensis TaxID=285568 RepID=UPI00341A6C16
MSSDRKPAPETSEAAAAAGPRPRRLTYAAALTGLEGVALVAGGLWVCVRALTGSPDSRQQAVALGITLVVLALLPLLAARGLLLRRGWSRGPAVITQIMALFCAYYLLQADSLAVPAGIVTAVVSLAALVLLVSPATAQALGIRGPGRGE